MKNKFQNDTERIQELKTCLEKSHELLHNAEKVEDVFDIVRTLIRDTLSRYKENKKFLTADVKVEGSFEFLDEYELDFCDKCCQMTNHLDGICQKCNGNER